MKVGCLLIGSSSPLPTVIVAPVGDLRAIPELDLAAEPDPALVILQTKCMVGEPLRQRAYHR